MSTTITEFDARAAIAANFFRVAFMEHALPKMIYDPCTFRLLEVNRAVEQLYGYTRAELLGMSVLDIRPPEHVERARKVINGKASARRSSSTHCTKDGKLLDVNVYSQLIDLGDSVARLVTITDAVARDTAVQDSDRLLELVLRRLPGVVFTTNLDAFVIWAEGSALQTLGLLPEEVCGRPLMDWVDADSDLMRLHTAAVRGERGSCEVPFGDAVFSVTLEPLRDDDDRICGVIGLSFDVTERVAAEASRQAQEEQFRALIEHSSEVVLIMDAQTLPRYISTSAMPLLGYGIDELRAAGGVLSIAAEEDRPRIREMLARVLEEPEQPIHFEARACSKDGEWRVMECVARNMLHHPAINGIILNCRDITEKRAAQDRLQESEEQLRQSQKLEAVGRLAGGIAHDFNNVLTAIAGHADLLAEMFSTHDPRMNDVAEIKRASDRAAALTRQLLAFSRRQVMQAEIVDLRTIVIDMEKMLERLIGADIRLQTQINTADSANVLADLTQIEQVLLNLVVNARDAMPSGGVLTIAVDICESNGSIAAVSGKIARGRYVRMRVADTGAGIPTDVLPHIFEPFYTTKERGRGTGLGLATVYGIVKQSEGYICVASEPGAGTRFDILLPHVSAAAAGPEAAASCALDTDDLSGSETIMLVEDEPAVRKLAERVLARHGYRVLCASNGDEALTVAQRNSRINLVITDLIMPEMNGRELADRLLMVRPQLRVLYMSGYAYGDRPEHAAFSERQFLAKPFTADGLARKVREVLAD